MRGLVCIVVALLVGCRGVDPLAQPTTASPTQPATVPTQKHQTFWDKLATPDESDLDVGYQLLHGAPIQTPARDLWANEKQLPALKLAMQWRDKILTDRIDWGKGFFYPDVPRLTRRSESGRVTRNLVADYIEWRANHRGRSLWVRETGDGVVLMIESPHSIGIDDTQTLERWIRGELSGIVRLPADQNYVIRLRTRRDRVVTGLFQLSHLDKLREENPTEAMWWHGMIFATDGRSLIVYFYEYDGYGPNFQASSFRYPDRF